MVVIIYAGKVLNQAEHAEVPAGLSVILESPGGAEGPLSFCQDIVDVLKRPELLGNPSPAPHSCLALWEPQDPRQKDLTLFVYLALLVCVCVCVSSFTDTLTDIIPP